MQTREESTGESALGWNHGNLCSCATDAAYFLKARFKGLEMKPKLTVGIRESCSETLDFLTRETPASFQLLHV